MERITQRGVHVHGQRVFALAGRRHMADVPGHGPGVKELIGILAEHLAPAAAVAALGLNQRGRHGSGKQLLRGRSEIAHAAVSAGFVLHLHQDDGALRVGLPEVVHECDECARVRGQGGRRVRRQRVQHLALRVHQARKTPVVEFHPLRRVVRTVVFPGGKPEQDEFEVMRVRFGEQRVEERKIELAFDRLDLFPGDGHRECIGPESTHRRPHFWQHGRPGARVVHLRAQHEVGRSVDHERAATIACHELRCRCRGECHTRREQRATREV